MGINHRHALLVICDGGFRKLPGRPGVATYAWLVSRPGKAAAFRGTGIVCRGRVGCNFMAEYAAVVAALRWLCRIPLPPAVHVTLFCDCEAVVQRLTGARPPLRRRGLVQLHQAALRLTMRLRARGHLVLFQQVPRNQVRAADKMCRQAYESRAARHPKALARFLRDQEPTGIPNWHDLHAKLFTKVDTPPYSERITENTQWKQKPEKGVGHA